MSWASFVQKQFMEQRYAAYHDAKLKGIADENEFHESTFAEYTTLWTVEKANFTSYAVNEGTPEDVLRKKTAALRQVISFFPALFEFIIDGAPIQRLREWFKNKKRPRQNTTKKTGFFSELTGHAAGQRSRKRKPQEIEAYNTLYIKPVPGKSKELREEHAAAVSEAKTLHVTPEEWVTFQRKRLREMFKVETQEVRDRVTEYRDRVEIVDVGEHSYPDDEDSVQCDDETSAGVSEDTAAEKEKERLSKAEEVAW